MNNEWNDYWSSNIDEQSTSTMCLKETIEYVWQICVHKGLDAS